MAKRKNRKTTEAAKTIDMTLYVNSDPVVEQCKGCDKVFDFVWQNAVKAEKCLTYFNPASKWPKEGDKFAMMTATVREIDDKGKADLVEREIPIIEKFCPVASHLKPREIVNVSGKKRVGQQKHGG